MHGGNSFKIIFEGNFPPRSVQYCISGVDDNRKVAFLQNGNGGERGETATVLQTRREEGEREAAEEKSAEIEKLDAVNCGAA